MNFEEYIKIRGNKRIDKYSKNSRYKVSWFYRVPNWTKILAPATLFATASLVFTIGVLPNLISKNNNTNYQIVQSRDNNPSDIISENPQPSSVLKSSSEAPTWDQLSMPEKYPHIEFQSAIYSFYPQAIVTKEYVGEKIEDTIVNSNFYQVRKEYAEQQDSASLYLINNISSYAFVTVKFSEDSDYYLYYRAMCEFQTIAEILDSVSFDQEATIMTGVLFDSSKDKDNSSYYKNLDKDEIVDILFGDEIVLNSERVSQGEMSACRTANYISLDVFISGIGVEGNIQLYESGYIDIRLVPSVNSFLVGEEKYQQIKDYLQNNGTIQQVV